MNSKYDLDKLQEFAHEKVKDFILEFGVACFSMYYMNLPLWANYANDHKGVCLQFDSDIDKDFFLSFRTSKLCRRLNKMWNLADY